MGALYALSPFMPIPIVKSVLGGGGFSSGHRWGILGGRQGYDPLMRVKSITAKDPGQNILLQFPYNYDTLS